MIYHLHSICLKVRQNKCVPGHRTCYDSVWHYFASRRTLRWDFLTSFCLLNNRLENRWKMNHDFFREIFLLECYTDSTSSLDIFKREYHQIGECIRRTAYGIDIARKQMFVCDYVMSKKRIHPIRLSNTAHATLEHELNITTFFPLFTVHLTFEYQNTFAALGEHTHVGANSIFKLRIFC